jgi:hypothetical protein
VTGLFSGLAMAEKTVEVRAIKIVADLKRKLPKKVLFTSYLQ